MGFLTRSSGLRRLIEMRGKDLGTQNFSTLSHVLRNPRHTCFIKALLDNLQQRWNPVKDELIALDSMAISIPITQRHNCKKMNNKTAGGGVLWAWRINPKGAGEIPARVLKIIQGAWCDNGQMDDIDLQPCGPVYLMDRGFYSLKLLKRWCAEEVRFIVRVNQRRGLRYEIERQFSVPRRIGDLNVEFDGIVILGAKRGKNRPRVRLIRTVSDDGKPLILATTEMRWGCKRVLDSYRKRWEIERFHRVLKDALGLAHLYSFHPQGVEFLLHIALLLSFLIFLDRPGKGSSIERLNAAIIALRLELYLDRPWRRNSCVHTHSGNKRAAPTIEDL